MSKFITAKDLAAEFEMNERTFLLAYKIRELGLEECRDKSCNHPVRFHRVEARRILLKKGHKISF